MKYNARDLIYLIKHDYKFRSKLKKISIMVIVSVVAVAILFYFAASLFITALLKNIAIDFPEVGQILFNNARGIVSSYFLQDISQLITPLTDSPNLSELKNLVTDYFEKLKANSEIDFQSFQKFVEKIKNTVIDGVIMQNELEEIKKLIPL